MATKTTATEKPLFKLPPLVEEALNFDEVQNGIPTGVWAMGAPILWSQEFKGKGVKVAVIDTGIDDSHPDLKGKVVIKRDYVKDGLPPIRWNPHGTHVAGTIAANGVIKGVAPAATLCDYRVLDIGGSGSTANITLAIRQAVKDGCDIINMSLGGSSDDHDMHQSIKEAVANGVLVVCAAGNLRGTPSPPHIGYPGYYEEVVCVAAVDFDRKSGSIIKETFSYQNDQVDVAADGVNVLSTIPGGRYAQFSGTSMATPHIAGFAALLCQRCKMIAGSNPSVPLPKRKDTDGNSWEAQLFAILKEHAVDIQPFGLDWATGAGFVTSYPQLPQRTQGKEWVIPGMKLGEPLVTDETAL